MSVSHSSNFETRNHTVLVGIFENDIQVQVLRIKNLQPKDSCLIGKTVENALTELTNSFEKQSFQKGYKCLNIFCSKLDTTFIPENELSGIQCNCPVGKEKHEINVRWTLAFWREVMSSTGVFGDRTRFAKLGMAIIDVLTQTLRDILEKEIPSTHIYGKVNSTKLPKGVKGPNPEQKKLLDDAKKYGYQKFDIILLYMLIRNYCSKIDKPTNDWGFKTLPAAGEITVGDDVERIRLIRNEVYGHVSSASASQDEFDENWSIISDICRRLKKFEHGDHVRSHRGRSQETQLPRSHLTAWELRYLDLPRSECGPRPCTPFFSTESWVALIDQNKSGIYHSLASDMVTMTTVMLFCCLGTLTQGLKGSNSTKSDEPPPEADDKIILIVIGVSGAVIIVIVVVVIVVKKRRKANSQARRRPKIRYNKASAGTS
ncbi:uncharacterized protein LOC133199827 [Saccostrea echinata]|uniref:uncharacterized protein LOC133199827 n=1 Tax=Saccostrea echinata TaxID=191078 RepID=UPI002A831A80|nr:uncharacterized protein LOC133199827 [Saccostrea echinata]